VTALLILLFLSLFVWIAASAGLAQQVAEFPRLEANTYP